jgi:succinate dehydrogenase / fumarate reductase cytochrome b subunit
MSAGPISRTKGVISVDANAGPGRLLAPLATTVGQKYIVAVTGLILVGFLVGHFAGNALIFKGRDALNAYARGLRDLGALLWVARIGLLVAFVVHIAVATRLNLRNKAARPEPYRYRRFTRATFASRTMLLSGLVILAFTLYHLAHYTFAVTQHAPDGTSFHQLVQTDWDPLDRAKPRADVYRMVVLGFQNVWVSLIYVAAQLVLALHLSHGVGSTFQTLGWNAPRYGPLIRNLGWLLTAVIVLGNISIPAAVLAGWVQ